MRASVIIAMLVGTLPLAPAAAQPAPEHVDITLSNFRFTPAAIHLRHGQPYVLTLHNHAAGGHSFEAQAFFAASDMPAADRARVQDGKVEVPPQQEVSLLVTPSTPGTYRFHCTHPMHGMLGMMGEITVD